MEAEVVGQADVVCCVTEVLPSLFFCLRQVLVARRQRLAVPLGFAGG